MDDLSAFVNLSAVLTGFSRVELQGTGVAAQYWHTVLEESKNNEAQNILGIWRDIQMSQDPNEYEEAVAAAIMGDTELGPFAQNIIMMWYLGQWTMEAAQTVSSEGYRQGLVWTAINAHTQGANQPGFGTWSFPPNYLEDELS